MEKKEPCGFSNHQLQRLAEGLRLIFEGMGREVHTKVIKTSARNSSLYITFKDGQTKTIRISSHKPVIQQMDYFNIY